MNHTALRLLFVLSCSLASLLPSRVHAQDASALSADAGTAPDATAPEGGIADGGTSVLEGPVPTAQIGDRELQISYPKWFLKGHGANIGLSVRYREDDTKHEWIAATVSDGIAFWQVVFPERPEAGVKIRVEATYRFALPPDKAATLKVEITATTLKVASLVDAAWKESKGEPKALGEAIAKRALELDELLKPLAHYTTAEGVTARALFLKRLGFTPLDEANPGGAWTFSPDNIGTLSTQTTLALAASTAAETKTYLDSARQRLADLKPDASAELKSCAAAIEQDDLDSGAKIEALLTACASAVKKEKPAVALDATLAAAKAFLAKVYKSANELNAARQEMGAPADLEPPTPAGEGLFYGLNAAFKLKADELVKAELAAGFDQVTEERLVSEQLTPSDALLKIEAQRRWYDVSTGFVYVGKVDDVIVPTLLSICPAGCLKKDKGISEYGWSPHTLSVDFGAKAAVLDKHADPRHSDSLGLLAGASYNPIDVVRLSAGAYFFENDRSKSWNTTYYVGITVNILQAGELLGVFGLKEIPKASIQKADPPKEKEK